jgi:hypothetical protein
MNKSIRHIFHALTFIMMAFACIFARTVNQDMTLYLPKPIDLGAWQIADSVRIFSGDNLFDMIDGGADIYLEYGFQQALSAEYQNKDEHSIKLEIYEMKDDAAAYGMYSINTGTQGKKIQIGNEGMLYNYYLMFWKGRFLVFLSAADTMSLTLAGINLIAAKLDQRLGPKGQKPSLVNDLPAADLHSSKYFKGLLGLSSLYTFDHRNIFGMTEGVEGTYTTHRVYLFSYGSEDESRVNYSKALEVLKTSSRFFNVQDLNGHGTMFDHKKERLCIVSFKKRIIVVVADDNTDASTVCDEVIASLQKD